jgi:hypothetical protein
LQKSHLMNGDERTYQVPFISTPLGYFYEPALSPCIQETLAMTTLQPMKRIIVSTLLMTALAGMTLPGIASARSRPCEGKQTEGAVLGAVAGGLIGGSAANTRNKGTGTVIGAVVGAAVGSSIAKNNTKCRYDDRYAYQDRRDGRYDRYDRRDDRRDDRRHDRHDRWDDRNDHHDRDRW